MKHFLSDLRISSIASNLPPNFFFKFLSPALDHIFGLKRLRKIYEQGGFSSLDKQDFIKKLLNHLNIKIDGEQQILQQIPKKGPCIVICNHPHGFIEGLAMAYILYRYRQDTKSLANVGSKFIKELHDYFIFIHNLEPNSPQNKLSILKCFNHIKSGGLLLLFPAGKVSHYQKRKKRITDGEWNTFAARIAEKLNSPVLPVFISGKNSFLFQLLGCIHPLFKLMLLPREMMRLKNYTLKFRAGNLIKSSQLTPFKSIKEKNDFLRIQCYLNDRNCLKNPSIDTHPNIFEKILSPVDCSILREEILNLPKQQHLLNKGDFSIYYGVQSQIPNCITEITRLREITFRELNEGSGLPQDTDEFDSSYVHLFMYNHKTGEIIGAYRMGQTDILLKDGNINNLYLSQIFEFKNSFVNHIETPCLELGRSFIIKPCQKHFFSLSLLWKGIGAFVQQNSQYKTLYGTVSLSRLYDLRSISIIDFVLTKNTSGIKPKYPFKSGLSSEVKELLSKQKWNLPKISSLITGLEKDRKDLPVLLKKYHGLGASFHCIGIDVNFNHTPGLFLSLDLNNLSKKHSSSYLT